MTTGEPEQCVCYWVDEKHWFTHYGAVEPGSQMEPNPDCLAHFPRDEPGAKEARP